MCVCVCVSIFLLFFGHFLLGGRTKCYIYIFSVVVSNLGLHTRMQSGFLQNIFIEYVYVWASHSWGNVQHHFFPLKVCALFFYSLHFLSLSLSLFPFCIHVCVSGFNFFFFFFLQIFFFVFLFRNMEWKLYILYFMYGVIFMAVVALAVLVSVRVCNVLFWLVVTTMDRERIAW